MSSMGMPSNRTSKSSRLFTGTPTLPISGRGQRVVRAVAALGGQVEGDRQAGLPARQVGAVELVRRPDVGVPRVGAEDPRGVPGRLPVGVEEHVRWACHWLELLGGHSARRSQFTLLRVAFASRGGRRPNQQVGRRVAPGGWRSSPPGTRYTAGAAGRAAPRPIVERRGSQRPVRQGNEESSDRPPSTPPRDRRRHRAMPRLPQRPEPADLGAPLAAARVPPRRRCWRWYSAMYTPLTRRPVVAIAAAHPARFLPLARWSRDAGEHHGGSPGRPPATVRGGAAGDHRALRRRHGARPAAGVRPDLHLRGGDRPAGRDEAPWSTTWDSTTRSPSASTASTARRFRSSSSTPEDRSLCPVGGGTSTTTTTSPPSTTQQHDDAPRRPPRRRWTPRRRRRRQARPRRRAPCHPRRRTRLRVLHPRPHAAPVPHREPPHLRPRAAAPGSLRGRGVPASGLPGRSRRDAVVGLRRHPGRRGLLPDHAHRPQSAPPRRHLPADREPRSRLLRRGARDRSPPGLRPLRLHAPDDAARRGRQVPGDQDRDLLPRPAKSRWPASGSARSSRSGSTGHPC